MERQRQVTRRRRAYESDILYYKRSVGFLKFDKFLDFVICLIKDTTLQPDVCLNFLTHCSMFKILSQYHISSFSYSPVRVAAAAKYVG